MNGLIGIATLRCRTHTNEQKRKVPGTNCDNISDVFARFLTQRMFPKVHTTLVGYGGGLDEMGAKFTLHPSPTIQVQNNS
jgi:hypothetical protein